MRTLFSHLWLAVFACVHFCSKLSEGAVFPCSEHDAQFRNRILWASVGEAVSFKLCAKTSVKVFERIKISHPNHRDGWYPQPAGAEETLEVQVEMFHRSARITITVNKLQPADFSETFAVTLFAADENGRRVNDKSTFFFIIEESGPPHCPTDIAVTNYGHDYVILSWKPGLDGGSRQYFYVYYSKDNIIWYTHGNKTEDTIDSVSGLSSNTSYYFRVASWNQHSTSVDASICTRTVTVTTKSLIKPVELHAPDPERSDFLVLTLGDCLLLVGMLLMSALICWRRKVNRENRSRDVNQGQVEIPMVATQTGANTTPDEYITIVDPGYCSISTTQ